MNIYVFLTSFFKHSQYNFQKLKINKKLRLSATHNVHNCLFITGFFDFTLKNGT